MDFLYNANMITNVRTLIVSVIILLVIGACVYFEDEVKNAYKKTVVSLNGDLKIQKRIGFDKALEKMKKLGALYRHPKLKEPSYYLLYHLFFGLATASIVFLLTEDTIGVVFALLISAGCFVAGWKVLDLILIRENAKENRMITKDILTISNILVSQVKGGQYLGTAFSECSDIVKNERLKKALETFDKDVKTNQKTLVEAVHELDEQFDNPDVGNLCMIILQNEESGKSTSILKDLSTQIVSSEDALMVREREKLNRAMTYAVLLLFADVMGYMVYLFWTSVSSIF